MMSAPDDADSPAPPPPWFLGSVQTLLVTLIVGWHVCVNVDSAETADIPPPSYVTLGDTLVIEQDYGGLVQEYTKRREEWRTAGTRIEVVGQCMSACTLYLDLPELCAHPEASFWFHAPYDRETRETTDKMVKRFMAKLPDNIRNIITHNGGLTSDWLVLEGNLMRKLVPSC